MVYALTMSLKPRTDGAKFNPLILIEEQPGWCYLRLFKREYQDLIDWPSFPTLMEICSWEVELCDPDVLVGFIKPAGSSIWHIKARGHESWVHLEKYAKYIGHHIFGGDQNTYATVTAWAAMRWLTHQDTRALFNGTTPREWYNELFKWLVEGMPRARWNVDAWREVVHRQKQLPPIKRDLWINQTPNEVPHPQQPGYCYLMLFEEQYHNTFEWPAFPTWSQITKWDETLQKEGCFEITRTQGVWHVERKENRSSMWMTVERVAVSRHAEERVGIFIWTMEMAWNLAQALSGYKYWFRWNAPEPQEVPSETMPKGLLPHQQEMYQEAWQERLDHNATVEEGWGRTAEGIGQFMAQIMNKLKPDKISHPQLKLEMPERYEGDPAEINNWLWSMETYYAITDVMDLKRTIPITLQQIVRGKGNQVGTWSAVKLKEWIDMEKEFYNRVQEGTMPETASLRNWNDGIITSDGQVYRAINNKAPFVDWIDFV